MTLRKTIRDEAAEAAVLGAVMLRPEAIQEVREIVLVSDLDVPAHAAVYDAMLRIANRGEPIDLVTLEGQMRTADTLGLVGGVQGLSKLADHFPHSHHVRHHAMRVRNVAGARRFSQRLREIEEAATIDGDALEDPAAWCERAVDDLVGLSRFRSSGRRQKIGDLVVPTIKASKEQGRAGNIRTPWSSLDALIDGWIPPDLTIVAARPSCGKTAFMLDCVRTAVRDHVPALVFSLEMSAEQLTQRCLTAEARVDGKRWRAGQWELTELAEVTRAASRLYEQPLQVTDDIEEIGAILSCARDWRRDPAVFPRTRSDLPPRGLIVIDYLQLAHARGYGSKRELEIGYMSRSLKKLAKELHMPVLALAQLNRDVDKRKGHRPMLSDLRESGTLEQDGDGVIFLHRPDRYEPEKFEAGVCHVLADKQRNGQTGRVLLDFVDHLVTFIEHVPKPQAAPPGGRRPYARTNDG